MGKFSDRYRERDRNRNKAPDPEDYITKECRVCRSRDYLVRLGPKDQPLQWFYLCNHHYTKFHEHQLDQEVLEVERAGADPEANPRLATHMKFQRNLKIVREYCADYIARHPNATMREACMAYAHEVGLHTMIPPNLQETEDEREARLEREAIQDE